MIAAVYAASVLIVLTLSGTTFAWDEILSCRMEEETGFAILDGRPQHHRNADSSEIVFAHLDSATPSMKGNVGETRLTVLRRNADTVWLMEQPPLGGVNIYTLFRDSKHVIMSKQYRFTLRNAVLAITEIGQCR